jgi:hypothetical protein
MSIQGGCYEALRLRKTKPIRGACRPYGARCFLPAVPTDYLCQTHDSDAIRSFSPRGGPCSTGCRVGFDWEARGDFRRGHSSHNDKVGRALRWTGQIQAGRSKRLMGPGMRAGEWSALPCGTPPPFPYPRRNGAIPLQREVMTHTHTPRMRDNIAVMPMKPRGPGTTNQRTLLNTKGPLDSHRMTAGALSSAAARGR